jgi:hypothetical protein
MENNFVHRFLTRSSSHKELVVSGEKNIGDEVCITDLNLNFTCRRNCYASSLMKKCPSLNPSSASGWTRR